MGFGPPITPRAKLMPGLLKRPEGIGLRKVPKRINPEHALMAKNMMHEHGKLIAGSIAGGLILNGLRHRSGRAVDPMRGRPTGPYGY